MWLITVYYHEAHQDVRELGGSGSLGRAALVALRAVPSARVPPPSARRNASKICRLSYVLPVSAEEKRADARSYFGAVCFWRGGRGGGVFFSGKSFCLNCVPVKSRRALLASRKLGFGLLCSSEITEFYLIFFIACQCFPESLRTKKLSFC